MSALEVRPLEVKVPFCCRTGQEVSDLILIGKSWLDKFEMGRFSLGLSPWGAAYDVNLVVEYSLLASEAQNLIDIIWFVDGYRVWAGQEAVGLYVNGRLFTWSEHSDVSDVCKAVTEWVNEAVGLVIAPF